MTAIRTSESFVACWPYTAVAAMIEGESIHFAATADSVWFSIEKKARGYVVDSTVGALAHCDNARQVREFVALHCPEAFPICTPLVTL